ncbi:RNA polymerase sigma factor [uncultured Polaribacter sp.]|uniref:RNA polymerase sigma factor n=1 Tax=uncultured Polaribacter sp. TaxID=174711 RepID=UPI00263899C9|nr:RNA polymerase sigma-70 factor [uncultured Polaribacter sp.]
MNDKLLINQIKSKNKIVFKNCYELFFKDLVIHANKFLFDYSLSEDIVQEVFIYLWQNSDRIDIKTSFKAYLYAMVRNRSLNYLKSIKITDKKQFLDLSNSIVNEIEMFPILEEEENTAYLKILQAVDKMPLKMQKIFKLKFFENYKYSEIAEELQISINTVKTQLKRARSFINESLLFLLILLFYC